MFMLTCQRCHAQIAGPPGVPTVTCHYCGNVNAAAPMGPMVFVGAPQMMLAPKCSRTAYVLLGLFLGGLGIHNFVAGHVGRGVAQLLITLLTGWLLVPLLFVGFWVLIEIIVTDRDGNGVKMS